jgi:hypothetical protein
MPPLERLTILGTGPIGASVGLAAKRAGVGRVVGFDPDSEPPTLAQARNAATRHLPLQRLLDRVLSSWPFALRHLEQSKVNYRVSRLRHSELPAQPHARSPQHPADHRTAARAARWTIG